MHPVPTSPTRFGSDLPRPSTSPSGRPISVVLPSSPGRLGLAGLSPTSSSPQKNNRPPAKPASPALSVKFRGAAVPPKGRREGSDTADVQVSLAPLHVFLDVGSILGPNQDGKSGALRFIDELTESRGGGKADGGGEEMEDIESDQDSEEGDSRPGTPRVSGIQALRELETERERRRLEQMVLEDLDLGYDYRSPEALHKPTSSPTSRRTKVSFLLLSRAAWVKFLVFRRSVRHKHPPPILPSDYPLLALRSASLHQHSVRPDLAL